MRYVRVQNVEVVIARLPEGPIVGAREFSRHKLFQHLERGREVTLIGFADEQVNVFGHDDVSEDLKLIPAAATFEFVLEDLFCVCGVEESQTPVATERQEVIATIVLVTLESGGHTEMVTKTIVT